MLYVCIDDIIKLCSNNIGNKYLSPIKEIKIYVKKGKIYTTLKPIYVEKKKAGITKAVFLSWTIADIVPTADISYWLAMIAWQIQYTGASINEA